jgi:hypothetical protein
MLLVIWVLLTAEGVHHQRCNAYTRHTSLHSQAMLQQHTLLSLHLQLLCEVLDCTLSVQLASTMPALTSARWYVCTIQPALLLPRRLGVQSPVQVSTCSATECSWTRVLCPAATNVVYAGATRGVEVQAASRTGVALSSRDGQCDASSVETAFWANLWHQPEQLAVARTPQSTKGCAVSAVCLRNSSNRQYMLCTRLQMSNHLSESGFTHHAVTSA